MSDVNKLKDILSRSKAIMQKTEQNYGTTSNETQSFGISEGEEKEIPNLTENYISKNYNGNTKSVAPTNGRYRNLEKSKMPNFIKEAMINNPIEIPETPYHTFELDDVVVLSIVVTVPLRSNPQSTNCTLSINPSLLNLPTTPLKISKSFICEEPPNHPILILSLFSLLLLYCFSSVLIALGIT